MINPTHLRTFLAVAQRGSFAAAARRLAYTSSAVSQQIAALERDLQIQLFERETRGIRLTSTGRDLIEKAEPVVAMLVAFEDEINLRRQGRSGRARIATFPTASQQLLPHALATLGAIAPELEVLLDEGEPDELLAELIVRELDVVLVYEYDLVPRPWSKHSRVQRLLSEDLVLLLPPGHGLADRDVDLADLSDQIWISTREGTAGAQALERACGAAGFTPDVRYRSNDYRVIGGFVRARLGIALVPALGRGDSTGIATARVHDLAVRRHVSAVVHTDGPSVTASLVVDSLLDAARNAATRVPGVLLGKEVQRL